MYFYANKSLLRNIFPVIKKHVLVYLGRNGCCFFMSLLY